MLTMSRARPLKAATSRDILQRKIPMWHVYIIYCSDNSLYTGVTTDVSRRVKAHNEKSGGSYTRIRTPVKLAYQEDQPTHSAALKREAQIKNWSRAKKLALIKGCYKELSNLSKSRD